MVEYSENYELEKRVCRRIIEEVKTNPSISKEDLQRLKIRICRELNAKFIPSNSLILKYLTDDERKTIGHIFRRKDVRSISGMVIVAVMAKPFPCPHGRCIYCPGGPSINVPQSYTGKEPATLRAIEHSYDPYLQVKSRLRQLKAIGHEIDKMWLIVMGGTFPSFPLEYQRWFMKRCFEAIAECKASSLEEAQKKAETSRIRNVGITFETRPDYAKEPHADLMLELGGTAVEIGVQHPNDEIYRFVQRGHSVEDVIEATRILKDCGFKVCYHLMPGLPLSDFYKDLKAFKYTIYAPEFSPDRLKIYPTLVLKGTVLYEMWKRGEYRPYSTDEAARLIIELKKMIPPWIRIMRVQRDVPSHIIVDGVKRSDLRSYVHELMKKHGLRCRCIRCREVGHRLLKDGIFPDPGHVKLVKRVYEASEGIEYFISFEDVKNDILIGFVRLRYPSEKAHRPEIEIGKTTIVRELQVYGRLVPVPEKPESVEEWQHRGYGKLLMREAEKITVDELDCHKILVLSAIGTREYYRKLGYHLEGVYMSKRLSS